MINFLLRVGLIGVITITFTGCFEEEIACNSQPVQELVHEISSDTIKDKLAIKKFVAANKKEGGDSFTDNMINSGAMDNFYIMLFQTQKNEKGSKVYNIYQEVENEFKSHKFSLNDLRTISKDKELDKVECVGIIHISLQSTSFDFNVEYTAQLTDNKEKVYVELLSLD